MAKCILMILFFSLVSNVVILVFIFKVSSGILEGVLNDYKFEVDEVSCAKIIKIKQTNTFINNNPVLDFELRVKSKHGDFTLVSHKEAIPILLVPFYKTGVYYKVMLGFKKNHINFFKYDNGTPVVFICGGLQDDGRTQSSPRHV